VKHGLHVYLLVLAGALALLGCSGSTEDTGGGIPTEKRGRPADAM
jgi:hypothetical protein